MLLDPIFLIQSVGLVGIVFIIFAESGLFFGFFLPGDSLLFTAGILAGTGFINIYLLIILSSLAAIFGDSVGYTFGKRMGPKIFSKEDSFFFDKKHIDKSKKFFGKYGKKAIILARFMPIVRTFTPILAGVGEMNYKVFFSYNVIGGILWTASMSLLGFFFGRFIPNPDKYILPIIILIVLVSIGPAVIQWFEVYKHNK